MEIVEINFLFVVFLLSLI